VNSRLNQIQNRPELAGRAGYSASKLAKNCGVSLRTLQRFFIQTMGRNPKVWLAEQRQLDAVEELQKCSCLKEASSNLGYKHAHHFSRDFKQYWGYCPTQPAPIRAQNP
jgi:AraC-like DNA-binding protein